MKFSENESSSSTEGIASLAILKILLDTLQKKNLLNDEELDIVLSCAAVEVEGAKSDINISEAKRLIINILQDVSSEKGDTTNY